MKQTAEHHINPLMPNYILESCFAKRWCQHVGLPRICFLNVSVNSVTDNMQFSVKTPITGPLFSSLHVTVYWFGKIYIWLVNNVVNITLSNKSFSSMDTNFKSASVAQHYINSCFKRFGKLLAISVADM